MRVIRRLSVGFASRMMASSLDNTTIRNFFLFYGHIYMYTPYCVMLITRPAGFKSFNVHTGMMMQQEVTYYLHEQKVGALCIIQVCHIRRP